MMRDLGIHKYKGKQNTVAADKWLRNLEINFDTSRCPEKFKVQIAEYFLDEYAYTWWESVMPRYQHQEITWGNFKREFELKYFPPKDRDRLKRQFNNFEQRDQSVREYETTFMIPWPSKRQPRCYDLKVLMGSETRYSKKSYVRDVYQSQ